jgi:filamentous hemagglutinin
LIKPSADNKVNLLASTNTNTYKDNSQQVGGPVMVGAGMSGSLNLAATKINSDYQSVGEQSAIRAGDGGFNVNVQGKIDLVGGQITSTQAASDAGKNTYTSEGDTIGADQIAGVFFARGCFFS